MAASYTKPPERGSATAPGPANHRLAEPRQPHAGGVLDQLFHAARKLVACRAHDPVGFLERVAVLFGETVPPSGELGIEGIVARLRRGLDGNGGVLAALDRLADEAEKGLPVEAGERELASLPLGHPLAVETGDVLVGLDPETARSRRSGTTRAMRSTA